MDGAEPITIREMDVVSLYVDQRGEGDVFEDRLIGIPR